MRLTTPFATRLVSDMAYLRSARGATPESPKAVEPEYKHLPGSTTFPYEELKRATDCTAFQITSLTSLTNEVPRIGSACILCTHRLRTVQA